MKTLLKLSAAGLLLGASSIAANAQALGPMDKNGDGMISEAEFDAERATFSRNGFRGYDVNEDGVITEDEYATGTFRRYDADGDGNLNAEESAYGDDSEKRWSAALQRYVKQ